MEQTRTDSWSPVRSQPVLSVPTWVLRTSIECIANARSGKGDKIQFFPFYRPSCGDYPCLGRREKSSPSDAPHAVAVGRPRMQISSVHCVCELPLTLLPPFPLPPHLTTKDPGQTFIRLRIFIFRSGETTKRITPCHHRGKGEIGTRGKREARRPVNLS